MSRYIDATDIAKQIADFKRVVNSPNSDYMTGYLCALSVTEGMIAKTPTADVVEVVRCRDCKYLYCLDAIERRFYCRHSPQGLRGINIVEDNPYCSYGERREE